MEAHFVLIQRNGKAKKFKLSVDEYVLIGRSEECQISIDDDSCSSRHCKITCSEMSILVEDLKSKNGVYINNARTLKQSLFIDDKLKIGENFIYLNIKRMNDETINLLTYKGKEARAIGNLTMELDKSEDVYTKTINLKKRKQKITRIPTDSKPSPLRPTYEPYSKSQSSKTYLLGISYLASIVDICVAGIIFILLIFSVRQTYPHFKTIGLELSILDFILQKEVIPFEIVCFISSIVFTKSIKFLLGASLGELMFGIKK
jgi:pSer/pThr/pTyr-binding forkhead associated (FHA) protein